jgi:hypothetical protein
LIESSHRDKVRGWIMRAGAEAAKLDPADATGLAWSAMGLKVTHPERPHRLTLKVRGGEPSALGVALIEPGGGGPGSPPRVLLDACAAGPPILEDGPPSTFSWLVWPSAAEMVLVLLNRSTDALVRLGTVTITELDDLPLTPPVSEPPSTAARTLGLYLSGPRALEPFGGDSTAHDPLETAFNLAKYLSYCSASAVVLPEDLADRSARRALGGQADEDSTGPDRVELVRRVVSRHGYALWLELGFDGPGALPGLPRADSPDAVRRGLVRVDRQGRPLGATYHPLHPEVRDAMKRRVTEALAHTKLVSGDTGNRGGLMIRLGAGPTLLGTPDTGLDDVTFDRFVRESFSAETARGVPGIGNADPDRFAVRAQYLAGVGRMPWLTWRSRAIASLYSEMAEAAQTAAPGTVLALVTPGLHQGAAGTEARRVDRAGLAPSHAWRSVGLDFQAWPGVPGAPPVFRGVSLSTDSLAHDLATSPDLDALVAGRGQRGLLLTIDGDLSATSRPFATAPLPDAPAADGALFTPISAAATTDSTRLGLKSSITPARIQGPRGNDQRVWLTAVPLGDGVTADEPLGHALAALDPRWVFLTEKAVAGQEDRLRRFAAVLRSLPAWPAVTVDSQPNAGARPFGVALRRMSDDAQTFLEIANDSPYPIRLAGVLDAPESAAVEDLGRGLRLSPVPAAGGRSLVLDLLPYGVAGVRIGAPRVQLLSVTPYPSEAVLTIMQARFNELSAQLARLNHGLATMSAEPPNPGFEPAAQNDPPLPVETIAKQSSSAAGKATPDPGSPALPTGWRLDEKTAGSSSIAIDAENPHLGRGSLRLTAPAAPASVVSEPFVPSAQSSLEFQVYFRASAAGSKVRVWIEGESGGQPYVRRSELTVSTEWEARAVRASDIPPVGLESARLRFELMTPGVVWIDDLRVGSETPSKSARLNARITLLAALQAYREQRFADFARLAESHWIRQSSTAALSRLARANDLPSKVGERPDGSSDASASPLPSERKLR